MKLQSLRALIAIVEQGSFSEAALALGTSQSAMSNAIAELEEELGVRLLHRGRFGAVPTGVGGRVVVHARSLEGIVDAIRQEAALERGNLSGRVRISAFRSAATHVLPLAIRLLGEQHPDLQVEVQEVPSRCMNVTDALHAGTVDVALTMSILAADTIYWELFRDPYVAVVPADFRRSAAGISIAALLDHPLILSDGPCSTGVRERLLQQDPAFRPAFEISEDSTILALVAEGLGVAVMPELTLDALPPGVRRLELDERVERSVGAALLPGTLKIPTVRAMLRVLRNLFPDGEVPYLGEQIAGTSLPEAGLREAGA